MEAQGISRREDYNKENTLEVQLTYIKHLLIDNLQAELALDDTIEGDQMAEFIGFASGWSDMEHWGRWSLGRQSLIVIPVVGKEVHGIRITGRYFNSSEATAVWINQQYMGKHLLDDIIFDLRGVQANEGMLELRLQHDNPMAPADLSNSNDTRKI
jgi:hypothetical protein